MNHITVVTKLDGASGAIALKKFIALFEPLCKKIYVVSRCSISFKRQNVKAAYVPTGVKKGSLSRFLNWLFTDVRLTLFASKELLKTDVLVVIGSDLVMPTLLARLLRKKVVVIVIGYTSRVSKEIYSNLFYGLARYAFPILTTALSTLNYVLASRIVVFSDSMVTDCALLRYSRKIFSNGTLFVSKDFFRVKPITVRNNNVGFVGRLEKEKGIKNFISAIPLVLNEFTAIQFIVVGNGKLMTEVSKIIEQNNFNVTLLGWVPNNELPMILNELKLLVVPSYTEGLPNVVLEAMACGTPVLATPVGAIPDIIKDGETGFLFEPNDPQHIAYRVIGLLNEPELLEKVSINAHRYVRKNFSYEETLENWQKIFSKLHKS